VHGHVEKVGNTSSGNTNAVSTGYKSGLVGGANALDSDSSAVNNNTIDDPISTTGTVRTNSESRMTNRSTKYVIRY